MKIKCRGLRNIKFFGLPNIFISGKKNVLEFVFRPVLDFDSTFDRCLDYIHYK